MRKRRKTNSKSTKAFRAILFLGNIVCEFILYIIHLVANYNEYKFIWIMEDLHKLNNSSSRANALDSSKVSQLNNSISKMKYSFPKEDRFNYNRYKYSFFNLALPLRINSMISPTSIPNDLQESELVTKQT